MTNKQSDKVYPKENLRKPYEPIKPQLPELPKIRSRNSSLYDASGREKIE
jgi:hypothetical protein